MVSGSRRLARFVAPPDLSGGSDAEGRRNWSFFALGLRHVVGEARINIYVYIYARVSAPEEDGNFQIHLYEFEHALDGT